MQENNDLVLNGLEIENNNIQINPDPIPQDYLNSINPGNRLKVKSQENREYLLPVLFTESDKFCCLFETADDHGDMGGADPGDYLMVETNHIFGVDNAWSFNDVLNFSPTIIVTYHKGFQFEFEQHKADISDEEVENDLQISIDFVNADECIANGLINDDKDGHEVINKLINEFFGYYHYLQSFLVERNASKNTTEMN